MSLINEALKKAQRQRTADPAPSAPPLSSVPIGLPTAPRIAKRRQPVPARTQIIILVGGIAVILMGGVLAFLFLVGDTAPPPPPPRPVVVTQPAPVVVSPPPVTVTPVVIVPVAPVAPVAPVTPPKPDTLFTLPQSPAERTAAAAATKAAGVVSAVKPTGPVANPRVYEFLDALRITGIRISDTDPKVIMNDRVYRLNDLVDRPTGLRITRVESSLLVFVDATGYEYRKNF